MFNEMVLLWRNTKFTHPCNSHLPYTVCLAILVNSEVTKSRNHRLKMSFLPLSLNVSLLQNLLQINFFPRVSRYFLSLRDLLPPPEKSPSFQ